MVIIKVKELRIASQMLYAALNIFSYVLWALPWLEGALPEILCGPGPQRGFGNSFQPAIDAPRYYLMSCVIAPSAKMIPNVHPQPAFIHLWGRTFANIGDVVLNGNRPTTGSRSADLGFYSSMLRPANHAWTWYLKPRFTWALLIWRTRLTQPLLCFLITIPGYKGKIKLKKH